MKRFLSLLMVAVAVSFGSPSPVRAQRVGEASKVSPHPLPPAEVERIIRTLAAKETEFRTALNRYTFKRDAVVQTIGMGGQISGEYHRTSNFILNADGSRYERVLFAPMPTLTEVQFTTEDLEDIGGVQQFALETSKINSYNLSYVGKERIDELDLYVFDVTPKVLLDPKLTKLAIKNKDRYFQGRIWVDTQDLQIVKARGKGVPEGKQRFLTFESYREQIDGKYWFPTLTYGDESLVFDDGSVVRLRTRVRFTDYKLPRTTVEIVEDDNVTDASDDQPSQPQPTRKP